MARRSQREIARSRNQVYVATVLSSLVLAAFGWLAYDWMHPPPPPVDPVSLCPASGPKGHYVLLVDKTDPLTFTQKEAFAVTLRDLIEKRVPDGYLLSVFVLGEDFKENAKPLIELCNPGAGQDKSDLTANLKQLKRQYQERFIEPMRKQAETLTSTQAAKYSPIFEMLQMVSINAFRKQDVKGERRLIVMSDMLHNTVQFTMYKGLVDFSSFAKSAYGQKTQFEMQGVEVEIHYLINTPQLQTKRNLQFWEEYFNKAGARIVSVQPLEG